MAGNTTAAGTTVASRVLAILGAFDARHRALTLTESQLGDLDAPLEARVASEGAALVHAAGAAALTGAQV